MKLLQLTRLNWKLRVKLIAAYLGQKLFGYKLIKNQDQLISYFNVLTNCNLFHVNEIENYYISRGNKIGLIALRHSPSSDANVFKQVFCDKEYEQVVYLVKKYIPSGNINMIDGGANIGLTSIYLRQRLLLTHNLNAVLIEPSSSNTKMININLELQGLKSFSVEEAGLYNKPCYLRLSNDFRDNLEWSIQVEETNEVTPIRAIEINQIIDKYKFKNLDILKLDIEGAEAYLFDDEKYAQSFLQYVTILAIELHHEYVNSNVVLNLLAQSGFQLSKFGELYIGVNKNNINNHFID